MNKTHERFSAALHTTARAWKQALDRRLKHLGLGQTSWMAIALTAKAAQPLSQTDLALALGLEAASVVSLVDRLVQAGLVQRQPSPTDRRVKHVVLTAEGWALNAKLKLEAESFRREMLSPQDQDLLQQASELLERLQAACEESKA